MTPEGKIKAKLNRKLSAIPKLYRFMPVQMGMGAPALDYLVCANGRFVAIETKAKGKKPTPRQIDTITKMLSAGALVFVVDDDHSVMLVAEVLSLLCQ